MCVLFFCGNRLRYYLTYLLNSCFIHTYLFTYVMYECLTADYFHFHFVPYLLPSFTIMTIAHNVERSCYEYDKFFSAVFKEEKEKKQHDNDTIETEQNYCIV